VIDQDPPHRLRGDCIKMCSVLPRHSLLVGQAQICFINQRGRLKHVTWRLVSKVSPSYTLQFLIYKWEQLIGRGLVAVAPISEQLGKSNLANGLWWHCLAFFVMGDQCRNYST
jgi:hypothetical protein